ncbi:DUF3592 domain-containing protein [Streptomyces sp. Li-HN-5-11]|uniref:DUF3592 domain-containing protein n=1 Tax=Streptomyces sp. Li-HN-5-11 TaxID=3075432 RepID=UPI0028A89FBB|nr:DUF3592 domain-containing protein [Streptomyces sp. Li-HN-5-11]WNM35794.1 DUF3592 domain-containing protein [Streptomyces sp. Li-HN-5-11]
MDAIMSGQLVTVLLGLAVIGLAVYEIALQRRLRREGIRVQGVVVRHAVSTSGEAPSRHAVVSFVDVNGVPHEYRSTLSGTRKLPVGRQVPMVYLPGAPTKARIDIGSRRWGEVAIPTLFGMAFTAAGILWMVSSAGVRHH